jgi:hypothetical protein
MTKDACVNCPKTRTAFPSGPGNSDTQVGEAAIETDHAVERHDHLVELTQIRTEYEPV